MKPIYALVVTIMLTFTSSCTTIQKSARTVAEAKEYIKEGMPTADITAWAGVRPTVFNIMGGPYEISGYVIRFILADGEVHYHEYRDRDRVLRAGPPKFEPFP